jgi:hypothetical protein
MRGFFERLRRPNRIKSLKELDPRFRPRWHKLEIRLIQTLLLFIALLLVGALSEQAWLAQIGWYGLPCAFVALFALKWGSNLLATLGYWFPSLALKAAKLDAWLERDLEWGK